MGFELFSIEELVEWQLDRIKEIELQLESCDDEVVISKLHKDLNSCIESLKTHKKRIRDVKVRKLLDD